MTGLKRCIDERRYAVWESGEALEIGLGVK
jgi:hypothetical protein